MASPFLDKIGSIIYLLSQTRRVGKTYFAIELAKSCRGTLICLTPQQAHEITLQHKVQAYSVSSISWIHQLRGSRDNLILDQDASVQLLQEAGSEIEKLLDEIHTLRAEVKDLYGDRLSLALTHPNPYIRKLFDDNIKD